MAARLAGRLRRRGRELGRADALVRRVELAQRLAARTGDRLDPRTLGNTLLAGSLSTPTALSRAESATTSLALLLVSPDFQRR